MQHFCLSLAVVLHHYNAVLYYETVKPPSYTLFLWRNCRICIPNILFPVFMFAFIFHCHSFSPSWPLAFLIFSPPLWISMFFFLRNSSVLFSISRSSSFSVIHVIVNVKNNAAKDTSLFLFFLSKSPGGHVISFQIKPWVAFGLPYLLIELFYVGMKLKMKKSFGDRSFSVAAPPLWNALPVSLRSIKCISTFKSNLKTYLFKLAFNIS